MDAKTRLKRNKLAQEHFDVRADIFEVNDFDRETIAVESWKLGFDAGIEHERAKHTSIAVSLAELTNAALAGIKPLPSQIKKAFEALKAYESEGT